MTIGRRIKDILAGQVMLAATLFSTGLVLVIALGLYLRARPLLEKQPILKLLLGETWIPSAGEFGLKPFIIGTVWVTAIAVVIAVPLCLLSAIFLAEYAPRRLRDITKPLIDLLAGIPSVVYGVWGVLFVVPFVADKLGPFAVKHFHKLPYLSTEYSAGFSVLAGGIVLAIMIFPVIISVADEVIRAVPHEMREAAYVLGATRFETIRKVVLKKALPGLIAAVVLGVSRALGETMAVLMVAGNVPMSPKSVFDAGYPLPALIANNYGEVMSIPLYDSALLGSALILLLLVLFFNVIARAVFLGIVNGDHA
jgi:phosphate transport system permease protein